MSDYDDDGDFMVEDDADSFQYDNSDDSGEEEPDAILENKYYNAKAKKTDEPEESIKDFKEVVDLDVDKTDWGFKALKQIVKVSFKLNKLDVTLSHYIKLLEYISLQKVTKNYIEKSCNTILENVANSNDMNFLEKFYSLTLECLESVKNERLLQKTNLKLAKLWLDRKEYQRLLSITRNLYNSCLLEDGTEDQRKGTLLLEIFALEIQMYTETKNKKKLKALYQQCLAVTSAISHPKIMGVIRECGGKMHLSEGEWDAAQTDFFEAFKNYDEAGSEQRIQCLKYLVLANMLMQSKINPFDSQETKPYKNDKEIIAMTNLVDAYQQLDLKTFEKILKQNKKIFFEDDKFIKFHIEGILKKLRSQCLCLLIKPYTRIELSFIERKLNVSVEEVEDLIVGLILDEQVKGRIDQVDQILVLYERDGDDSLQYEACGKWASNLDSLYNSVIGKVV
ncbi:COP9 signalosome complex subunit 2 [Lobulomyces angularis]|nr:COP9 signalosome complex subunit 2 [Lobulomyces angularis]